MISLQHKYLCPSSHTPGEAFMVCTQEGCNAFALICSNRSCECQSYHKGHGMMRFEDMLEKAGVPLQLPEQLENMRKGVDGLIDGFILEMQQLKAAHANYIDQHLEKQLGTAALSGKLTSRNALEKAEATGDGFFRLNQEAARLGKTTNPYNLPPQELTLQIKAIG